MLEARKIERIGQFENFFTDTLIACDQARDLAVVAYRALGDALGGAGTDRRDRDGE